MLIKNLLYIFQIENYSLSGLLKFAYSHSRWWGLEKRAKLVWTLKAKLIYVFVWILIAASLAVAYLFFNLWGLLTIAMIAVLLPLVICVAYITLWPLDIFYKKRLFGKARRIISVNKNKLIVVGIAGSYGKTTVKEILSAILKEKFKSAVPGSNINTDAGLADFIIKNKDILAQSDIFVVEMGAFKKGEIKRICGIVSPDYGILTGINESHLEKFGSLENIIQAKFELVEAVKKFAVLNFDDQNVKRNYNKFDIIDFAGVSKESAKNIKTLDNFEGLEFEIEGVKFHTKLLALHNITLILLCVEVVKKMGLSLEEIARGVEKVKYVQHRLEPIYNKNTDILVIDDSYNGNFNGIVSGIEVLTRAKGRKIVLTPGLVELGGRAREIHNKIGALYVSKGIDLVLLIKNKVAPFIIEKLENVPYKVYETTKAAHKDLSNVLKSGDTIIFQNDWPDNYF